MKEKLRKSGNTVFLIIWELSVAMETRVLILSGPKPNAAFTHANDASDKFHCFCFGMDPPLPGYYQFFGGGGVNMSCSRTQHGDPSGARTPRPLDPESEVLPAGHHAP